MFVGGLRMFVLQFNLDIETTPSSFQSLLYIYIYLYQLVPLSLIVYKKPFGYKQTNQQTNKQTYIYI